MYADGYSGVSVPLVLLNGKDVISSKLIRFEVDEHVKTVEFNVTPLHVGSEIYSIKATPLADELTILKHRPNSFHQTDLHAQLQTAGITELTLVGAMTQMCIDATARAAKDLNYDVTIVAAACGAKAHAFGNVALDAAQVQSAFLGALAMSYARII